MEMLITGAKLRADENEHDHIMIVYSARGTPFRCRQKKALFFALKEAELHVSVCLCVCGERERERERFLFRPPACEKK